MLAFGFTGSLAGASAEPVSIDELRAAIPDLMKEADVAGAGIALIRDGEIAWVEMFGVKNMETLELTDMETEFQAASNGKMIAAYASFALIEEGRMSLNDPIEDARLTLKKDCARPTLGQALSHTAGLGNDIFAEEFVAACSDEPDFSYAGQGYHVVQSMIEAETGVAANAWIEERIFTPLDMTSARFQPAVTEQMATGHVDLVFGLLSGRAQEVDQKRGRTMLIILSVIVLFGAAFFFRSFGFVRGLFLSVLTIFVIGASALFAMSRVTVPINSVENEVMLASSLETTVHDLARFAVELIKPTLVSVETRDAMLAPMVEINKRTSWAAGIGIDMSDERTTYWHWGSNPGYQGLFVIDPDTGDGIVILTNTGGFLDFVSRKRGGYNMSKKIARLALGHEGAWDIRGYR